MSTDSEKISNQKAQIEILNSNIENFNNKIEQANLRANVDGVVTKMDAVANQYPVAGDEIVVDGTVQYVVDLQVSQYDGVSIKAGQKVNVTLKGISKKYEGTVSEIGQLAEKSLTSTDQDPKVNIKISITNPDENVKVGYEADAEIIIEDKTGALQVSFEAVQTEAGTGKKYVYTVDKSNVAKKTYIKTGIETDYNIEVLSGLTDGQKCISNPDKTITDGMKVREAGGKS
jgi:multidrug efflux pump subunit AcrA (membrane-fusion protein)